MPVGLHAERASRKLKGNASSSTTSSSKLREASLSFLNSVLTVDADDELMKKKTANYLEFIDSTFLMNDDKDCSKEVAEWLLKSSDEDDGDLTFERFVRALFRLYWRLPQNASKHKKSVLLGFSRYFNITKNNNKKNASLPRAASVVSNLLYEETRAYFVAFLEKLEDVGADEALEHVSAVSMLLSLYARAEHFQQTKDDDDAKNSKVALVFNAALDENAHLMIRQCKWILDTVMRDIKDGKNVSNVAACTDVATLIQRLLRDFCQCKGAEKEKKNVNNTAIIKERIVLDTLFDALEFNIFGGTSIGTALAVHLFDEISNDDASEETAISEQIAAAFGFSSTQHEDRIHVDTASISSQFKNRVEKQSNLALAHFLRGFVVTLAPQAFLSSTSDLARDVFFPLILTILERCEDPHAIFHAINAITTLLQRLIDAEISRDDFFFTLLRRVSQALLSRWDDINTTASTTREIACAFDALCDCAFGTDKRNYDPNGMRWGLETFESILNLTFIVNANGGARKSRFKPLSALAKRLGSRIIMEMRPSILSDILDAMSKDDSLGPSASWFLIELSKSYRIEESSFPISWKRWWTDALFPFLIQSDGKKRRSVATHALPIAFQEECGGDSSFAAELARDVLSFDDGDESFSSHLRAGAIVTITRAARNAQLCDPKVFCRIRSKVVKSANNKRERKKKRKEAFSKGESMHLGTNSTCSYDDEEVEGSFFDVPHSMIETAALSMCEISRTDAMELLCWEGKGSSQTLPGTQELALLKRILPHHMRGESSAQMNSLRSAILRLFDRMHFGLLRKKYIDDEHRIASEEFIKWLLKKSVHNLYPSAPYERKATAIEILLCATNVTSSLQTEEIDNGYARVLTEELLQNQDATRVLLKASLDSWDRLRKSAFDLLSTLPSPLPGVETGAALCTHLIWAKNMVLSPMVKESDAAALQMRLWIKKYVFELKWSFTLVPDVLVSVPANLTDVQSPPVFSLLDTLNDFIEVQVELATIDALAACKKSLAHGPLLLVRYALEEIDFNSIQSDESREKMRRTFEKLIDLIIRVTLLARDNISTPDMLGVSASEVARDKDYAKASSSSIVTVNPKINFDFEENEEFLSPEAQTVVTASWLTIKEVGLLIGALSLKTKHTDLLSGDALKKLGEHLISVILEVKHAGAIDKTRIGLTILCERLLDDYDVAGRNLSALPMRWLTILLNEEIVNKAKLSMKDRVRRSAGIPFAFLALLLSEKSSSMRPMLKYAIEELFTVLRIDREDDNELFSTQIHAFNVLRVIFKDRDLSLETSIYAAEGVELCINRMGATPQWEVRNAATLCFSSLVQKLTGITNAEYESASIKSQSKALHANDFFSKYPSLHAFFDRELELSAVDEGDESCEVEIRPSLNAILAILTRLKVNTSYNGSGGNGVGDVGSSVSSSLDPSSFIQHLEACSSSKYMSIRDRCATAIAIVARPFERSRVVTLALDEATYSEGYSNRAHGALLRAKSILEMIVNESRSRDSSRETCDEFTEETTRCALRGLLQSSHILKSMDDDGSPIVPALLVSTWLECATVTLQLSNVVKSCASFPAISSSRLAAMPSTLLEIVHANTLSADALQGLVEQRYPSEPGLSDLTAVISKRFVEWSIANGNDLSPISRILTEDRVLYEGKEAIFETLVACASVNKISDTDACTLSACIWNYLRRMTSNPDGITSDYEGSKTSLKLALQLLARWNETTATHSEHLKTLGILARRVRNEECRVEAIRTWGVLLCGIPNGSGNAANAYEFVTLLDRETLDWQSASTDVRLAAADALHKSGLLKCVFQDCEEGAISTLFIDEEAHTKLLKISFRLSEDEDDDVRKSACVGIMSAINGTTTMEDLPQTQYVLKLSLRALIHGRSMMKPWLANFIAGLLPEVCDESTIATQLSAFSEKRTKSGIRNHQKLFGEEEHPRREPMLLAQMVAHALKSAMLENEEYADAAVAALSAAGVTIEGCVYNLERFIDIAKSANMDASRYADEDVEAFRFVTINMIIIWMLKDASLPTRNFLEICDVFSEAPFVHPSVRLTALCAVRDDINKDDSIDDETQHQHPCFLL